MFWGRNKRYLEEAMRRVTLGTLNFCSPHVGYSEQAPDLHMAELESGLVCVTKPERQRDGDRRGRCACDDTGRWTCPESGECIGCSLEDFTFYGGDQSCLILQGRGTPWSLKSEYTVQDVGAL